MSSQETSDVEPVAIVGMSCRLPGGVHNPSEFWQFLLDKKSGYSEFPDSRINIDSWHSPEMTRPGIAYEAFESSGSTTKDLAGSKTGVYVGNFGLDQTLITLKENEFMNPYTSTGISGTILSNRINYIFDLVGPSFTIDTACSSSLYALHLACIGIRNGDCDGALVCAPHAIRTVEAQLFSTKLGALSPTSHCHTFDASADGYARADGFGAIHIMRLSEAIKLGKPIRAVIRGTAIGANGHGAGLTRPDSKGQAAVIRQAYKDAGNLDLSRTGYFECHGTGTPVGDPIETHSVGSVFADSRAQNDPLLIGSVKTNLGHSGAAAGITALIKTVLAIGLVNPNPAIKFDEWKLKVVTEAMPWPANIPVRRASVNSFGYGGANAHSREPSCPQSCDRSRALSRDPTRAQASLEEEREPISTSSTSTPPTSVSQETNLAESHVARLLFCSAQHSESLKSSVAAITTHLKSRPLKDVAYTLAHRSTFRQRAFAVVQDEEEPSFTTGEAVGNEHIDLCFIFTGQGAQWPQMGRELLAIPAFLASIRQIDADMAALPFAPDFSVEQMIVADLDASEMDEPRVAQIMSIALEIALVDLLADWNILPTRVTGHSAGEIAAAYAAGYLTRAEAAAVAYYRGRAVSETPQEPGGMLAVGLSREKSQALIPTGANVVIGAVNSPRSVTLSGDATDIALLKAKCDEEKIFNRLVATKGRAYHSSFMENAAESYSIPLHNIARTTRNPKIRARLYSTVTGSLWTEKEIPMSYWRRNMECPVLFSAAVSAMWEDGMTHALEIGPHSTLRSPILDIVKSVASDPPGPFSYLATMKRKEDGVKTVLSACGELLLSGYDANLLKINGEGCLLTDFPTYQWNHTSKFVQETRADIEWRFRPFAHHDLLGTLQPGLALSTRIWRNIISVHHVPWLADHKVGPNYIYPAAGFMSMAVEALKQVRETPKGVFVLRDVHIGAALKVDEDIEVFTTLQKHALGNASISSVWWEFNISSVKDGTSTEHAKGRISSVERAPHHSKKVLPQTNMSRSEAITENRWYDAMTQGKGLVFGPSFRRLSNMLVETEKHRASATIKLDTSTDIMGMNYESSYVVHPTILDNLLQISVLAGGFGGSNQAYVPVSVDTLTIVEDRGNDQSASVESSGYYAGFKGLYGSFQLLDSSEQTLISLEGLRFVGIQATLDSGTAHKREAFWCLCCDDDYDAITEKNQELYFPQAKFMPKQYDYPRLRRTYVAQMHIMQFSQKYPYLMTSEPLNVENKHFIEWAHWLIEGIRKEHPKMYDMSIEERHREIEAERPQVPEGVALSWALYDHLHEIIAGEKTVLDVATEDGRLGKFYETQLIYDKFERVIEIMGFKNPDMKILEIGAGTGSASGLVLKALTAGGTKRYSNFLYTDISTSFFVNANIKFGEYEDIEYKVYDMERDPEEQDIEPESLDLVIASCTVHVTGNINSTLKYIRKLLKPGGKMLLSEITAEWHDQTFALGLFPGFYKGYDEGRTRHPFLTPEQWAIEFPKAGFSKPELSVNDIPGDFGFTVLTATAIPLDSAGREIPPPARENTITLVHLTEPREISHRIERLASQSGISVQHRPLVNRIWVEEPDWKGTGRIIVVAELEHDEDGREYFVGHKGWNDGWRKFRGGLDNGFFQCLDINPQMKVASMDFEQTALEDEEMAEQILHRESKMPDSRDKQFRQHEGRWLISRLLPDQRLIDDFARSEKIDQSSVLVPLRELDPVKLSTTDAGRLSALVFLPDEGFEEPLKTGDVEIQVKAVGMNMVELSALTGGYDTDDLSTEFSGVITKVGSALVGVSVGDHVFAMHAGRFGNYARVPGDACQKAPNKEISFEALATLPSAYCTALYSLVTVGQVQAGETLLIQSATGGFGMASIAIARQYGAEIFVTAGSEAKRDLLHSWGIPRDHIYSSRDLSAYNNLREATNGKGFDLILNTSSGDYLHQVSWPLVAPFGRFIELKKADIVDNGILSLKKFNEGVSFTAVDMHYVCKHKPHVLLVLTYKDDDVVPFIPSPSKPKFHADAAYLIIGGLTGIGSYLCQWMVLQGVRNLVVMARSEVKGEAQQTFDKLRSMGANVTTVQGNVSKRDDVRRALTVTGLPVRGVINSALVLRNKEFNKLTVQECHETFEPKAATQSSYSAANCYMNEFARFRRKRGLACTSINLGFIGNVGFMSRNAHNTMHLLRNGHYMTLPHELMALFSTALFREEPADAWKLEELVAVGTEPTKLRELLDTGSVPAPLWERDSRWEIVGIHAMKKGQGHGGADAGKGLAGDVQSMVADRLARLLWIPVEKLKLTSSLSGLGIDIMIASEFQHWMYQTFKLNVSMMELLAADMTVEKLSDILKEQSA
ncbi:polyketide synthase [Amylocarpus encephaloides]|uniref:Polyketide synthase n=1 Tax=Amylocarpus encephaloides TaxID=45428 RepID=A0A9P7YCM3_9HELO|nr:polyketide synthase [Amylocarpus encephaloides]